MAGRQSNGWGTDGKDTTLSDRDDIRLLVLGRRTAAVRAALEVAGRVLVLAPRLARALRGDSRVEHLAAEPDAGGGDPAALADEVCRRLGDVRPAAVLAATEAAVVPAARLRAALGVAGIGVETAVACTDKVVMKERIGAAGIPHAPFVAGGPATRRERVLERAGLPVVLKPRIGSGGRGTRVVQDADAVPDPLPEDRMAEALLAGQELSVESLVLGGEVVWSNLTEYVETRGVNLLPYRPDPATLRAIRQLNRRSVAALGVERGVTHLEVFLTPDGLRFGELAVRPPGGHIMELISFAYGFDAWQAWVRVETGEDPGAGDEPRGCAAARVIHPGPGRVLEAGGLEAARRMPGVRQAALRVKPGDTVPERLGAGQEIGHLIVVGPDRDATLARLDAAGARLRIRVRAEGDRPS